MNRLCETCKPSSTQECALDDSGALPGWILFLREERTSANTPLGRSSWSHWKKSGDGGWQEALFPAPSSTPCLQNTSPVQQVCVQPGNQLLPVCTWGLDPLKAPFQRARS